MLVDKEKFNRVEEKLRQNGTIKKFEEEYGEIKGRMMITLTDIPDDIEVDQYKETLPIAFEASFDFYDSTIGLAMYTEDKKVATGVWVTPQTDTDVEPSKEWIEFFIITLAKYIKDDGSFGIPMFSFVNDTCDMTIVPEPPEYDEIT